MTRRVKVTLAEWQACADAGMTAAEAAAHVGVKISSAYSCGVKFRDARVERMKALNADPEFAERSREASRERMKALNADPEFAERNREASRERMKALNADPEFNPLAALTTSERCDYDVLVRKGGMGRNEALRAIKRADLVAGAE